jgi:hypothetical protein
MDFDVKKKTGYYWRYILCAAYPINDRFIYFPF